MKLTVDIHKKFGNFCLDSVFETEDLINGILGSSGSGKSLTLKCIAGIETPDEGYIELNNKVLFSSTHNINIKSQDRKIGYLFQNYALFPTKTVKNNILCGLHREKKQVKLQKYQEIMKFFRLENLEKHFPYQLSGGEAQRTALARMLVTEPDLLLLDEPFSALDTFLRKKLQTELTEVLKKLGKQAIIVTHSQLEVRKMTSKLFLINNGHIIQHGNTEEVFSNPSTEESKILLEE